MTINKWIAVAGGILLVAFFLYGNVVMDLFRGNNTNSVPMQQTSGIIIEDLVVGQGEGAVVGDTTIVHYVGKLTTGQVFDSSRDRNQTFPVTLGQGRVIKGWEEGLLGMKVGGTRRLTISPELAYGPNDYGPIPGNSTLIFDIELIDIVKPAIQ